tara:strand:- start:14429 stop:16768 length:2340 start_codon:yes stop_codon:yes gene_type:complete
MVKHILRNWVLIILGLLLGFSPALLAQPSPVSLSALADNSYIGQYLSHAETKPPPLPAHLTPQHFASLPWQPLSEDIPAFSYSDKDHWFHLSLKNDTQIIQQRLLEISYPPLDRIDIYVVANDRLQNQYFMGDRQPFAQRPMAHRHYVAPLLFEPGQQLDIYSLVRTSSTVTLPVKVWQTSDFYQHDSELTLLWGAFFGIMTIMVIYNLFLYSVIRDPAYLFYILYVLFTSLFVATLKGYSFQYIWPNQPAIQNTTMLISASAAMLGVSLFAKYFLHLKTTLPWGDRLFNIWLGLNALAILCDLFIPYQWMAPIQILLVILTTFSALIVGVYCWRQQVFSAHIYVIAWTCYVVGSILFGLNKLDFIPAHPITENALQIGSLLEIIILSLALADRLNAIRQEKIDMQKQAVDNLRRYELLYENALEGIFRCDLEGRIVHANPALLHHLGYSSLIAMQQAKPNLFNDVFSASDSSAHLKQALTNNGLVSDYEIKGQRLNGEDFWAAISARAITDLSDNSCYVEGFMIDVTDRKQRDKEILELNQTLESRVYERTEQLAQVNKELESFAYSVSHDLKAPLRRIDGFATMLEEDMAEKIDDSDRELLNRIKGQAHEMNDLIDGMLTLSRSSRGQLHLERINLSAMVQEICEHIRSDTTTHARFVIQPDVQAYGDRNWLHSALDNLLRNAVKFSSKKDMPVIEFGKTQQNNTEAYFVRDNGAGFNSQRADNLFVPFQRLHAQSEFEGTGIGLATVARIINRHQGKIWAEAQERKGATFYFSLRG